MTIGRATPKVQTRKTDIGNKLGRGKQRPYISLVALGFVSPLFGAGALILVNISVVTHVSKAGGYSQAEQEYLRKREALMRNLQQRG